MILPIDWTNVSSSVCAGIITTIICLIVERIWNSFWQWQNDKTNFQDLKQRVIDECAYNQIPGVGLFESPFVIDATKDYALYKGLNAKQKKNVQDLIAAARLCSGSYGRMMGQGPKPGHVRKLFEQLANELKNAKK
jgi:hypothetical protein